MLYSIQFLRAVASIAVVISHCADVMGIPKRTLVGDAGVDLFFIISGFVIGTTGPTAPSATNFLLRRVIRVMPLYWLALGALIGFEYGWWGALPGTDELLHSAFLIPTHPGWMPMLFPAWTLTYEMLFYALFGLALAVGGSRATLLSGLALMLLGSVVPMSVTELQNTLLLEFLAGLLLARIYHHNRQHFRDPWAGSASILCGVLALALERTGASVQVIGWGIPCLAIVAGALHLEGIPFFRRPLCTMLGAASYAIYLFHITVMVFMREAAVSLWGTQLRDYPVASSIVLVPFSVGIGLAIHLWLERPLLALLRRAIMGRQVPLPATMRASEAPR